MKRKEDLWIDDEAGVGFDELKVGSCKYSKLRNFINLCLFFMCIILKVDDLGILTQFFIG
jgi:hypothetical protein